MLGKRGQEELSFWAFSLVMAAVVILSLAFLIKEWGNRELFEKEYVTRDLALVLDALQMSPGDVELSFKNKFATDFSSGKVSVGIGLDDRSSTYTPVLETSGGQTEADLLIEKKDGRITIKNA